MTEETNNKGMQQAKGGVLAQSDIELLRKSLEFYIKNSDGQVLLKGKLSVQP